jgi:hypothetical protein
MDPSKLTRRQSSKLINKRTDEEKAGPPTKLHRAFIDEDISIIVALTIVSLLGLWTIILWGLNWGGPTPWPGAPTISRFLTDNVAVRSVYVVLIVVYAMPRFRLAVSRIDPPELSVSESRAIYVGLGVASVVFGYLQIIGFVLIAVVTLDVDVAAHSVIASLVVAFSLLREIPLFARRGGCAGMGRCPRPRPGLDLRLLIFNGLIILFLVAFSITFAVLVNTTKSYQHEYAGWIEYLVFFCIVFLLFFMILDVDV